MTPTPTTAGAEEQRESDALRDRLAQQRVCDLRRELAEAERAVAVPPAAAPGLSAAELDAIEARAKAAVPGPWQAEPQCGKGAWIKSTKTQSWTALSCGDDDLDGAANAAHIAGMDPPTTLALVAMARASLRGDDRYRAGLERAAEIVKERGNTAYRTREAMSEADPRWQFWSGASTSLMECREAIRAEAASPATQPDLTTPYTPRVVDYPETGFSEFMLEDVTVWWQNHFETSVAFAVDDNRPVGVRWPTRKLASPQPDAGPEPVAWGLYSETNFPPGKGVLIDVCLTKDEADGAAEHWHGVPGMAQIPLYTAPPASMPAGEKRNTGIIDWHGVEMAAARSRAAALEFTRQIHGRDVLEPREAYLLAMPAALRAALAAKETGR